MTKPLSTEQASPLTFDPILHKTRRFVVTLNNVRSENDMYTLDAVSHCRLRRPLLIPTTIAVASLSALVSVWWDDLFSGERLVFGVACTLALTSAALFARLQLMSLELRDHTYLYDSIGELRSLKRGIENALNLRKRLSTAPARRDVTQP